VSAPVILVFEALDTFWFREGRPFEQTDDGLAEARGVFPPSPATLAGAVAAAIARSIDGSYGADWTKHSGADAPRLRRLFGLAGIDGGDEPQAQVCGPFLADEATLWAPWPATLMIHEDADEREIKAKHIAPVVCDALGAAGGRLLPTPVTVHGAANSYETPEGAWMRAQDLFAHMADMAAFSGQGRAKLPLRTHRSAAVGESRIGIALDPRTRSAKPGQLYASRHWRPAAHDRLDIAVAVFDPSGAAESELHGALVQFGGKGRIARLRAMGPDSSSALFAPDYEFPLRGTRGRLHFRLTAITPVPVDPLRKSAFGLPLGSGVDDDLWNSVTVDGALIPSRPAALGMWRSFGADRVQIMRAFAPGSTWFLSIAESDAPKNLMKRLRKTIVGRRFANPSLAPLGFGRAVAGEWPTREELLGRMNK
jgi:CRISPR-associated protein Cmr3